MLWQIQQKRQITKGIIVFALLMGLLLGIADEVHQTFIPNRRFNPVDMIYNLIYSFRYSMAVRKYGAPYDQLGPDLQKEIRKVFPMALSETMK